VTGPECWFATHAIVRALLSERDGYLVVADEFPAMRGQQVGWGSRATDAMGSARCERGISSAGAREATGCRLVGGAVVPRVSMTSRRSRSRFRGG
jgi:hypothetical protein